MSYSETPSNVRKLRVFIPSPQSPLLTTYGRLILDKIEPLKSKYKIKSQRKQVAKHGEPQTEYLTANDIDKLNRSYEAIKRSKGEHVKQRVKQSLYHLDPLYRSIYDLKHISMKTRANSQRRSGLQQCNSVSMANSPRIIKRML